MPLPRHVNILGVEFEVMSADLKDDCGESKASYRTIFIDEDIPEDTKTETLYHEITHMILAQSGAAELLDEKTEEAICQAMGAGLYVLFKDQEERGRTNE
jgi:hypothetical protein